MNEEIVLSYLSSFLLDLLLTGFVYLGFPVFFVFTKIPITKSQANKIALINSIVCSLLCAFVRLGITGRFSLGFAPATLYYFINKRILAESIVQDKANDEDEDENEETDKQDDEEYQVEDEEYDEEYEEEYGVEDEEYDEEYEEEIEELDNETDDPDEEVENETGDINEEGYEEEYEEVDKNADDSKDNKENEYALEIKRLKNLYLKWENLFKDILKENPSLKDKYEEYEEVDQEETVELDKKEEKGLEKKDEADNLDDNQLSTENQQDKSKLGQNLSNKKDKR